MAALWFLVKLLAALGCVVGALLAGVCALAVYVGHDTQGRW